MESCRNTDFMFTQYFPQLVDRSCFLCMSHAFVFVILCVRASRFIVVLSVFRAIMQAEKATTKVGFVCLSHCCPTEALVPKNIQGGQGATLGAGSSFRVGSRVVSVCQRRLQKRKIQQRYEFEQSESRCGVVQFSVSHLTQINAFKIQYLKFSRDASVKVCHCSAALQSMGRLVKEGIVQGG